MNFLAKKYLHTVSKYSATCNVVIINHKNSSVLTNSQHRKINSDAYYIERTIRTY